MARQLRTIWTLMQAERLRFGCAILALVAASCFLYLTPLVPQVVIDGVLTSDDAPRSAVVAWGVEALGGREHVAANLWWPLAIIAVLALCAGGLTYLRGRLAAQAAEGVACRLRAKLFDDIQRMPVSKVDEQESGDLLQRCTSDVETFRMFLATQVVEIGRALVMLIVPLPLMALIDWRMTLAAIAFVPFIVGYATLGFVRIRRAFKLKDEAEGAMTATIQENLTGIRVVRAFARQELECERFDERNRGYRDLDRRLYDLFAWFWSISDITCFAQRFLVTVLGLWWVLRGELAVGAFFYFLTAVNMFVFPLRMMGRILADLGKATVAVERIDEILAIPPEDADDAAAIVPTEPVRGGIDFDGVSFAHGDAPVLHDVTFSIAPGETLALLGPSGCGKSTIVNLLLRLYDADSGTVRLDGADITTLERRWLRGRIATAMQEPFLYGRSIRENLVLARPGANEKQMVQAAAAACVHDAITAFEQGYDTRVGERGVTLSGGQRQRVALARALLQDAPVLVLDDAISAVDTRTEGMILDALRERHGRRTTILIAHRLSTLMHADRVLVLEHGRIVQSGTHAELAAAPGLYRRLWRIQNDLEDDAEGSGRALDRGPRRDAASRDTVPRS